MKHPAEDPLSEFLDSLHEIAINAENKWGRTAQILQTFEELNEFGDALAKYSRGRCIREDLTGEFVDLLIMLAQVKYLFSLPDIGIRRNLRYKLTRLREDIQGDIP